ncbi:hypothetical protein DSUL_20389 [Desulfovibrionales bacterium]
MFSYRSHCSGPELSYSRSLCLIGRAHYCWHRYRRWLAHKTLKDDHVQERQEASEKCPEPPQQNISLTTTRSQNTNNEQASGCLAPTECIEKNIAYAFRLRVRDAYCPCPEKKTKLRSLIQPD